MTALKDKIAQGALIIDVRTVDEYQDGHYEGALHIPLHVLPARLMDLGDKNRPVVLYCASGSRSSMAARLLKEAGFSDVTNAGGLDDMPGYTG